MSLWKRSGRYWADFSIDGTRYRKPLGTRKWQEARKRERVMIEAARHGQLETQAGPKRLFEAVEAYLAQKAVVSSERTVELERERLSLVKQHLGDVKLSAITPEVYSHVRLEAKHKALEALDAWREAAAVKSVSDATSGPPMRPVQ